MLMAPYEFRTQLDNQVWGAWCVGLGLIRGKFKVEVGGQGTALVIPEEDVQRVCNLISFTSDH